LLNKIIDYFQAKFPPNRLVALLTAPVAAGVAAGTAWVAQHFPGLPAFSNGELTAFALAGALALITAAYKWIDGWQKHEERGGTVIATNDRHDVKKRAKR
jgi:hypothetical protein